MQRHEKRPMGLRKREILKIINKDLPWYHLLTVNDFSMSEIFRTSKERSILIRVKGKYGTTGASLYGGVALKVSKETFERLRGREDRLFFPAYGLDRREPFGFFRRYVVYIRATSSDTDFCIPPKDARFRIRS